MALEAAVGDEPEIISCPFTWKLENVVKNQNKLLEIKDDRFEMVVDIGNYFPEFVLIYHLLLAYEKTVRNDKLGALQSIIKAEKSLSNIKQKSTLKSVEKVLDHIVVATKCYVIKERGDTAEVKRLLQEICKVENFTETESAMLSGCKCLAWSLYYETVNLVAIDYAKRAIELDRYNGKWYFLLGKNYRRLRRLHNTLYQSPSENEISAYAEAYRLSQNPLFGVSLAQAHRESQNRQNAIDMYKDVYDLQPNSVTVRLQLALGFIRVNEKTLARSCLDYVGREMPDSVAYNHYMGIYYEKCCKNVVAALPYYENTTERFNFSAEWQYIKCKKRVDRDWDPLPYMLELLNKYEKASDHVIQDINNQIGLYYLFNVQDVLPACPYLTKAIEIQPSSQLLKNPYVLLSHPNRVNVIVSFKKEVQSALQNRASYDDGTIKMFEDALRLCELNL